MASLLTLGLAGCSSPTPGTPEPTNGGETTSAANDPFQIGQPKNLKAVSEPCQLLTPQQLQQLGATTEGKPAQAQWGQTNCAWDNEQLTLQVSPDTVQGQGIRYIAKIAGDDNGNPTAKIDGYPAVHEGKSSGSCGTYVGVSDKEMVLVHFGVGSEGRSNPEFTDPCATADKIAGMVISNLPPA
ncbi:DUF3558 family protein [Saccharopolyspora spinosa]|uniref:DUF3558 family protein n=1 Tax=Saccharopolyspora spinosa TaxID=60894 RepID=UPI003BABDC99